MTGAPSNPGLDHPSKMELKFLAEDQNTAFDWEYHTPEELQAKIDFLRERFPDDPPRILDVGGGNGRFLDGLLLAFTNANGYLIDISQHLLSLNAPNPRKHLVHGSLERLEEIFPELKFDVITMNWVLHHLVGSTWERSVSNSIAALELASRLLSPNGVIAVAENMLNDILGGDLPSHIIYAITSVRNPLFVKLARPYFNTAGVGVCFHSQPAWERLFAHAGLKTEHSFYGVDYWAMDLKMRIKLIPLSVKSRRHGHYFLSKASSSII
jgi:SAM-dependent methyltransferase